MRMSTIVYGKTKKEGNSNQRKEGSPDQRPDYPGAVHATSAEVGAASSVGKGRIIRVGNSRGAAARAGEISAVRRRSYSIHMHWPGGQWVVVRDSDGARIAGPCSRESAVAVLIDLQRKPRRYWPPVDPEGYPR